MGFILLLVFVMAILWGVMTVFSFFKGVSREYARSSQQQQNNNYTQANSSKPKKIFDRDEGKYVGYEEIND